VSNSDSTANRNVLLDRRTVVACLVGVGGCAGRDRTASSSQTDTQATPTATETEVTDTGPRPTDTVPGTGPTSTLPSDATDLAVTRLFGPSDDRDHSVGSESVIGDEFPAVRLVTDRAGWREVRREIEAAAGTSYDGVPVVEATAFGTECLVVLQTRLRGGANRLRLAGTTRDGDETVRLRVEELSRPGPNNQPTRLLLVRIPSAERVERVVVRYVFEGDAVSVETGRERSSEAGDTGGASD